jgi:hypothetical protein
MVGQLDAAFRLDSEFFEGRVTLVEGECETDTGCLHVHWYGGFDPLGRCK